MLLSKKVTPNRTALCCAVLLGLLTFTFGLNADVWNKKTIMTFNEPVEIAGEVLPAGKYVFKLVDSSSNRHIVQILNEREDHVFKTILTIPEERMKATGKTEVAFEERPAGQPQALKSWFYPGDLTGREFVTSSYPGTMVARAKPVDTPVVTAQTTVTEETVQTTPVEPSSTLDAQPQASQPSDTEPLTEPAPFVDEEAQPEAQAQSTTPASPSAESSELPKTASNLPITALAGLSSLGIAAALRLIRKKV